MRDLLDDLDVASGVPCAVAELPTRVLSATVDEATIGEQQGVVVPASNLLDVVGELRHLHRCYDVLVASLDLTDAKLALLI